MKSPLPLNNLMEDKETFSKLLVNARYKLGMTQQDIADQLCVSTATISKWESGKARPERARLMEISRIIKIPYLILSFALENEPFTGKEHYIMITPSDYDALENQISKEDYHLLQENVKKYANKKIYLNEESGIITAISLDDDEYSLYKYICDWRPGYPPLKYFSEIVLPAIIQRDK